MAVHETRTTGSEDGTPFRGGTLIFGGLIVGVIGLSAAVALGSGSRFALRPFLFGYLAAYVFAMALALGSLAFVLLQHLTRAGWSVAVRRIAENYAAAIPVLALFAIPLLVSIGSGNGYLYRWAIPEDEQHLVPGAREAAEKGEGEVETPHAEKAPKNVVPIDIQQEVEESTGLSNAPNDPTQLKLDPLILMKRDYGLRWLNPAFLIGRVIFYLIAWSAMALWFRGTSLRQDRTGDDSLTLRMQNVAPPCVVLLAFTVTGFAFDLLMSLDPHWYSTMFGVYYIAECLLGSFALLILTSLALKATGRLRSLSVEHFHDMGKYLFAFTFFFGYIAFSQYMLIWYANIPEETGWFVRHGASTVLPNGFSRVIVAILIGHILIPFGGLLSRHPKRFTLALGFWALWQLLFCAIDMYWIVLPEKGSDLPGYYGPQTATVLLTAVAMIGMFGVLLGAFAMMASRKPLLPVNDPRLADSLAYTNA